LSSSVEVPPAAAAGELDPLVAEWEAGRRIVRCHNVRHGPAEFNRTASAGRFRPVRRRGRIVGTLYGSEDIAGAVSETVFHALPVGEGARFLRVEALAPVVASTLSARRALRLASLHGHGLRRLGATRAPLIDSEADQYPARAAWSQAVHDCAAAPDGLVWRSRHYDDAYALMLFGDRVRRRDLEVTEPPLPLGVGRGLERLMELAERAGITLVR
jgi:hypothetical protein